MRWPSMVVTLVAAATATAAAQPAPDARPTPPGAPPISVRVVRAIGGFDADILRRELRRHAATCGRRGGSGTTRLRLMLRDEPRRHGMRVIGASGDAGLRRCLGRVLAAAAWPTGHLDSVAEFTVVVRVAP
ncbi:MAG: hypothetical protein JNK64_24070 [Myxococcales bacterium]|nr:hypothetical protein [Myxococcales bacterium]